MSALTFRRSLNVHVLHRGWILPPPPQDSAFLDYVVAADGVFARSTRPGLEVCIPVAEGRIRGLDVLQPYVKFTLPKVAAETLALIFAVAQKIAADEPRESLFHLTYAPTFTCDNTTGHIDCRRGWHLAFPPQVATEDRVSVRPGADIPRSEASALIEIHSHHRQLAYFSDQDDRDEGGLSFRIYGVIGDIFHHPTLLTRVGLFGHFHLCPPATFFEIPEGVTT